MVADFDSLASAVGVAKLWNVEDPSVRVRHPCLQLLEHDSFACLGAYSAARVMNALLQLMAVVLERGCEVLVVFVVFLYVSECILLVCGYFSDVPADLLTVGSCCLVKLEFVPIEC